MIEVHQDMENYWQKKHNLDLYLHRLLGVMEKELDFLKRVANSKSNPGRDARNQVRTLQQQVKKLDRLVFPEKLAFTATDFLLINELLTYCRLNDLDIDTNEVDNNLYAFLDVWEARNLAKLDAEVDTERLNQ